jgi:hypothetical protein
MSEQKRLFSKGEDKMNKATKESVETTAWPPFVLKA